MLLLAFDTATPAVTVALHDGTHVLAETTTVDARRHGELLASSIDAVLAEAGAAGWTSPPSPPGPGRARTPACGWDWSPPGCSAAPWSFRCTGPDARRDRRRRGGHCPGPGVHRGHGRPAARGVLGTLRRRGWPAGRPGGRFPGRRRRDGGPARPHRRRPRPRRAWPAGRRRGRAAVPRRPGRASRPPYPAAGPWPASWPASSPLASSPTACWPPGPSRSTCAGLTPGCPGRRSG